MDEICYTPIGVIHTPWTEMAGTPLQSVAADGVAGSIDLLPAYAAGLRDVEGFSHLILLYHLHRMTGFALDVTPYLDTATHGIFATRSPKRPNPIGFSVVRLTGVEGATLRITDVDMLDGTPLLDIKPYVPTFDHRDAERTGWFASRAAHVHTTRADERFR
ncbi:MAG: tRNA (N6-threonylcarbamoyladenosine(37)-N6)-methyltransferase TrmO [Thermomicrobiales bacterium]